MAYTKHVIGYLLFPWADLVAQTVKRLPEMRETWVRSLGREDTLEKETATTPVLLPGKFHGQRSLVGYSSLGRKESDITERPHVHFHIFFLWADLVAQLAKSPPAMRETWVRSLGWENSPGEENSYPVQYSGLENSMDYIVHGVAKSWT